MPHIPPAAALASCESALRQLLTHVLVQKYGASWITSVFEIDKVTALTDRRDEEARKRTSRGVAAVSDALLDYANFYELVTLAERNWELVSPALGKKAVSAALLHRFDDLRNTVAHSRDLLPFEEDLLAGIAGEIRNRVTLFMSTQAPNGEHYARAEMISDSFGNTADPQTMLSTYNSAVLCAQTLRIGDTVTFRCRGWDPHSRRLTWRLRLLPSGLPSSFVLEGDEVEITWTVDASHVSNLTYAMIDVTSDSPFHRWGEGVDALCLFGYTVEPPPFSPQDVSESVS